MEDHAGAPAADRDWDPEAMYPFGPRPVPEHRWFESKSLAARLFILIAGVTMNVLLTLGVSIGVVAGYGRTYVPAVVDSVLAGRPAALAGVRPGDSVVAVNGEPVRTWSELLEQIRPRSGQELALDVVRAGAPQRIIVRPRLTNTENPTTGAAESVGQIGAAPRARVVRERVGFADAVAIGAANTYEMGTSVLSVLRGLFAGTVDASNLGGPIAIAQTSVEAARLGGESFLSLIAFLSINIAIMNLLPIPVLDGGQILINVLEGVKGSAFSARTREYILRTGVLAVLLLFALVMYNDLRALVSKLLG